ncbi:hypothetical protein SAMN05421493_10286 [Pseudobutyrivibrio sp. 49]|uniref:hypothetical protein n=1 Tax=Pseudobutyrivibrio sp. 49 TaxID=1855344 RepID=UPI000886C4CD|nr:hypothetical protein [Pseudobutyrivibrio sp. 49]SDH59927.1 hypothetical protein SAMN05421493_10286 [Pseudobutyrivibrio sp. 49]
MNDDIKLMYMWIQLNEWLNSYGGFISLASFFFSFIVFVHTGQIKKEIKKTLKFQLYQSQKRRSCEKLESIVRSIEIDNIFDSKIYGEIVREVSSIDHFAVFMNRKARRKLLKVKRITDLPFDKKQEKKLVSVLNNLVGELKAKELTIL